MTIRATDTFYSADEIGGGIHINSQSLLTAYVNGGTTLQRRVRPADGFIGYESIDTTDYNHSGYYIGVDEFLSFPSDHSPLEVQTELRHHYMADAIRNYPNENFLGIWYDADTETDKGWTFDVTVHAHTLFEAMEIARRFNQTAIYDIANEGIIYV